MANKIQEPKEEIKKMTVAVPDGGWGWIVVFGSFMVHLIAEGISYSFGILFVEIFKDFGESKRACSWVGSILLGVTYSMGPLASIFLRRFGCRACTIVGSVIAALGFGSSFYATSLYYLYVSMGLVGGIGLGLMYLPAIVSVSSYFQKRLSLATGIAACGSGLGLFTLAPVFEFTIAAFGWRLSLVGAAAALLSCSFFGALFRPLPTVGNNVSPEKRRSIGLYRRGSLAGGAIQLSTISEEDEVRSQNRSGVNSTEIAAMTPMSDLASSYHDNLCHDIALFQAVQRGSAIYPDFLERAMAAHRLSISVYSAKSPSYCQRTFNSLKSWKGFTLLANPVFVLIAISTFFIDLGYHVPYIYLADVTKETLKIENSDSKLGWIVSTIGISSTVSRIVLGYISDRKGVNRLYIYCGALILCGVATALSPVGSSFLWLVVCAAMFGLMGGVYISLTSVILIDFIGIDMLSEAFGIVLLFQGMGILVGPPLVGTLFDRFGTYNLGFLFSGLAIGASGALLLCVPFLQKGHQNKNSLNCIT